MDLVLGRGEWHRERGNFPPWRQENCLLEEAKTDPKGYNILSRPPLVQDSMRGAGPIEGIFQKTGLFNGDIFCVSFGVLYRGATPLGALDGSGVVIWAAGTNELVITRGTSAWSYNGTDLVAIATGFDVNSVHWMARRFLFARKGTGRFYWSEIDDGRTVDALNFANAESEPDELLDIAKMGDVFAMLGSASVESWVLNGDPDLPWTRVSQRTFGRGIRAPGAKAEVSDANTFYFVSSDNMVCRMADAPQRVSDAALEEKIRAAAEAGKSISAFWYQYEGRPFVAIRLKDRGTYVLDIANDHQPSLFTTQGRTNWAVLCATVIGGQPLFGHDEGPQIWRFDPDAATDCGKVEMARYFSAGMAASEPVTISNVIVSGDNGSAKVLSGEQSAPILEMRTSNDGGRTFGPWKATGWGRMGQYRKRARFGSCGMFGAPGFLAEFRMQACAPLRVDRAACNESAAGRGR